MGNTPFVVVCMPIGGLLRQEGIAEYLRIWFQQGLQTGRGRGLNRATIESARWILVSDYVNGYGGGSRALTMIPVLSQYSGQVASTSSHSLILVLVTNYVNTEGGFSCTSNSRV